MAGLSMRGVAEQLDAGAASLYGYVSGREELLELVFDELVGQVPLPTPDAGSLAGAGLRDARGVCARCSMAHRDAALAGLGRVPTSPKTLAAAEALVPSLRAGRPLATGSSPSGSTS